MACQTVKGAAIPAVIAELVALPVVVLGLLNLYFGSYEEIPGVAWVIMLMLLFAGLMFGVGILLV